MHRIYLALLFVLAIAPSSVAAQTFTLPTAVCPRDSIVTVTEGGMSRQGTSARRYVESFLGGDPAAISRTSTGTAGLTTAMIAILSDVVEADRTACARLNHFISNGESNRPSPPWVYFRAGNYYFVARWTPPLSLTSGTRYEAVMIFDSSFNLLDAWTV